MGPCLLSITDLCEQCVDANCCPQYDACLAADGAVCNDEIAYWQGITPPPAEAYTDAAVVDLGACIASSCTSVCTHYHKHPRLDAGAGSP
jgi:hypothetical protein